MTNNVYIGGVTTITPKQYRPNEIIEYFYSDKFASERCRKLVNRLVKKVGIKNRPTVINLEAFPNIKLINEDYNPVNWGADVIDNLVKNNSLNLQDIGHLSVSYNITSCKDFIPNLACQIAFKKKLTLDSPPEELFGYGCASGILALKSAIKYCQDNNKAAIVYMFEHSLTLANPIYDVDNIDFKANLRSHLLFSDGAAGLLVLPESMIASYKGKYLEVIDINFGFHLGDAIKMKNGRFLVGDNVKNVMPKLVSSKSVQPLLRKNNLLIKQIDEWSIHQGGIPVLDKFKDKEILGLSEKQIENSKELFKRYGNFSTPSCFFVLDDFFKKEKAKGKFGSIVSFGAGYYYGTVLYKNIS